MDDVVRRIDLFRKAATSVLSASILALATGTLPQKTYVRSKLLLRCRMIACLN